MSPMPMTLAQTGSEPAGGAALGEIALATGGAIALTVALLVLGMGHRSGRVPLLGRWAKFAERVSGLPGWATLPSGIATVSLVTAVVGMYWDISLHIDVGRDPGPLANPAHYLILAGLFGIFSAGFIAVVLPKGSTPVSSSSIRLAPDWHAPLGGVLVTACGAFALIGFPLDDVWHRLFGQDVTLWGPTHLMLIGGASMTLLGLAVLLVEAQRHVARVAPDARPRRLRAERSWVMRARAVALTGGFLLALSTFQAEFDFGVPQFRFVFQPLLIMMAAGVGLVAVRHWAGRGGALGAVVFFLVIRGGLALFVGPIAGETTPHFPLYIVEAVIVELVALRVARDRPLALGLWSGVGIGTLGLAAEWGWSHVWMPLPWPSELLPEAALLGFLMAVSASLVGVWVGARLDVEPRPGRSRSRSLRTAAVVGACGIAALVGFSLYKPSDTGVRGAVALTEVRGGADRTVQARVELTPRDAADDAEWLTATAWQGDGLVVDRLRRVREGVYETTRPIPVHGNWKAMLRLHVGNSLTALPIYLPEDRAIPAREVPAKASFTRAFISDHKALQREAKSSSTLLTVAAYLVVLAIALALLALLAWGLHRLARGGGADGAAGSPPPKPAADRRARPLQPA